jgi:hypothetical protein
MLKQMLPLVVAFAFFFGNAIAQNKLSTPESEVRKEEEAKTLPAVIVNAKIPNQFDTVGEYNQPVWTTTRMFPTTRAYVMTPPGAVKYEKWFDFRDRKDGPTQIRMRDELSFGLGNRMQLDLYNHTVYDGPSEDKKFGWRGFSWELRYALADWGKIPGNPTLYFEHKMLNGTQGIEPKLLLSDRIGQTDWVWATNFIYEANLAKGKEAQEREYAVTASIGKILSNKLSVGATAHYRYHNYENNIKELYIGPNMNYRIGQNARVSLEYLPLVSNEGKYDSRGFFIFAWDLQ